MKNGKLKTDHQPNEKLRISNNPEFSDDLRRGRAE
jgi:hypothetical protein